MEGSRTMTKIIKITVSTGYVGCSYEEEVEFDGQTEEEIAELVNDFKLEVCCNHIEAEYEIEDEDDD